MKDNGGREGLAARISLIHRTFPAGIHSVGYIRYTASGGLPQYVVDPPLEGIKITLRA